MSSTKEPESDEVTKKMITRRVAAAQVTSCQGSVSSTANNAKASFSCTASVTPPPPKISMCSAVPPSAENHRKLPRLGTSSAVRMNSRTVRPFEMRATKMPTNGDQEIHQLQ